MEIERYDGYMLNVEPSASDEFFHIYRGDIGVALSTQAASIPRGAVTKTVIPTNSWNLLSSASDTYLILRH